MQSRLRLVLGSSLLTLTACDDGGLMDEGSATDGNTSGPTSDGSTSSPQTATDSGDTTDGSTESADTTDGSTDSEGGVCGDGEIDDGEQCDDGNTEPGDGCDASCQAEDIPPTCGNDVLDPGEECDDGNNEPLDGCSPTCELEMPEACGNDMLDPGEECDDGNTEPGDGCDENCQQEVSASCGDGVVDRGEECDDGNPDDDDDCLSTCVAASCGDGVVWVGHETCDDGNTGDGDGCSADCVSEACGNGVLDLEEQCDNGGANGTPGNTCFTNCILIDVTFEPPLVQELDTQARGDAPRQIEAGDFNDDGRVDLITVNQGSSDTTVLYGFGDGRFWAPHLRNTGSFPHDVELADLNGDGRLDAITANEGSDNVSVFLGGGAAFEAGTIYSVQFMGVGFDPRGLAIDDVTGDGNLDVVVANQDSNTVSILAGDGAGGLTATASLGTFVGTEGTGPTDVKIADVTDDGELDIVTCNTTSDDITLLPGLGGGTFGAAQTFTTRIGAGGDNPEALELVDVTGDGVPDAITANPTSDDIVVLVANAATDTFNTPIRFVTLSGADGDSPSGLAVGDVTGDGEPDVVTANTATSDVTLLVGIAGGATFELPVVMPVNEGGTAGIAPRGVKLLDMDGDGSLDIVTSNTVTDDVSVLVNDGTGSFGLPMSFESRIGYDGEDPRALALGDVNADGIPDVVVANQDTADITVVAGLGEGRLAPSQTTALSGSGSPQGVTVGDLDGDGRLDWVASEYILDTIRRGTQSESGQFSVAGYFIDDGPRGLAAGDIDGDMDLDLVVASFLDSASTRILNSGSGTFSAASPFIGPTQPWDVALFDVTGDGELDMISASTSADTVRIFPGNGAGSFAAPSDFTTAQSTSGRMPVDIVVGDVTGDGLPDVMTANADSNDIALLANSGGGVLAAPVIIPATFDVGDSDTYSVRLGDFDGDGELDLATANRERDTVSVIFGFGGGDFSAPQEFDVGDAPSYIAVGDFNDDGLDDIASVDTDDDTVTVLVSEGH